MNLVSNGWDKPVEYYSIEKIKERAERGVLGLDAYKLWKEIQRLERELDERSGIHSD